MKNKKAFTLVELIVVITILAILGTIAFISLQSYSKNARDSKRISDVNSLLTKIRLEETKWTPLIDMLIEDTSLSPHNITLNWDTTSYQSYQWTVNFEYLKEDENKFKDPSNYNDYLFAFSKWVVDDIPYTYIQMATVSESENVAKLVWNYYKFKDWDSKSLFLIDLWWWTFEELEDNWTLKPYDLWPKVPINWECWSNNWWAFGALPTTWMCNSWISKSITLNSGVFTWICKWYYGWTDSTTCQALQKIDWVCWTGHNSWITTSPTGNIACEVWDIENLSWAWPWTWDCAWPNWWAVASCQSKSTCLPHIEWNWTFAEWNPAWVWVAWQNTNSSNPCFYTCDSWFEFRTSNNQCVLPAKDLEDSWTISIWSNTTIGYYYGIIDSPFKRPNTHTTIAATPPGAASIWFYVEYLFPNWDLYEPVNFSIWRLLDNTDIWWILTFQIEYLNEQWNWIDLWVHSSRKISAGKWLSEFQFPDDWSIKAKWIKWIPKTWWETYMNYLVLSYWEIKARKLN